MKYEDVSFVLDVKRLTIMFWFGT